LKNVKKTMALNVRESVQELPEERLPLHVEEVKILVLLGSVVHREILLQMPNQRH
jgi:hypothetical protein